MHIFYLIGHIYPFFAIPVIVIFAELGIFFKRRVSKFQYFFWVWIVTLSMGIVGWVVFRGDIHSDQWVRYVIESIV